MYQIPRVPRGARGYPIFAYVVYGTEVRPIVEALIAHGELPRACCIDATLASAPA